MDEQILLNIPSDDRADSDTEIFFLHQILAKLPDEQQESIILFEISGFSIKEIAALHGVTESAVKKRLERGRKKLAHLLRNEKVSLIKKEELP